MSFYLMVIVFAVTFSALWQYFQEKKKSYTLIAKNGIVVILKPQALAVIGVFLVLWLTVSCIGGMGGDYWNYRNNFWSVAINGTISKREPAFDIICRLVQLFTHNPQVMFFVINFITYFLLLKCINDYTEYYTIAMILYFATYIFFVGIPLIRQIVAVMLVFYAYRYIMSNQLWKFLLYVILASTFHITALIVVPFFFIFRLKLKMSYFTVASIILLTISLFRKSIILFLGEKLFPQYMIGNNFQIFLNTKFDYFFFLNILFLVLLLVFYYQRIDLTNMRNLVFCNCSIWFVILNSFCWWVPEAYRLFLYFNISTIITIPLMLSTEKNRKVRAILLVSCVVYYFAFVYIRLVLNDNNQLIPYVSFINVFA